MNRPLFWILLCALAACIPVDPEEEKACTPTEGVELEGAITNPPSPPVSGDLILRGTTTPPSDVTVYAIEVAGIAATSASFNYRTWTVTLPIDLLRSLPQVGGKTPITGTITSNCAEAVDLPPIEITVAPLAGAPARTIADDSVPRAR